jgi:integrase
MAGRKRRTRGHIETRPNGHRHAKYRRLAQRVGLRSTRIHTLRHYSATKLLTVGVNLRTVDGRLGGATTLRSYAAWVEKVDRAAGTIADLIPAPTHPPHPAQSLRGTGHHPPHRH